MWAWQETVHRGVSLRRTLFVHHVTRFPEDWGALITPSSV